jgi:hypothetical protein
MEGEGVSGVEWLDEPEIDGWGRITYGRWGGYTLDVCPMLFNDRVVMTPEAFQDVYDYGWCFPKGGAAELALRVWDPATEAEPAGYIKAVGNRRRAAGDTAADGGDGVQVSAEIAARFGGLL